MKRLLLVLAFALLIPEYCLAININLPYTNNFTTDQDLSDVYFFDAGGGSIVYARETSGGYGDNGSCIKGVLQNHGSDDQSGLGEIHWGTAGDPENQINIGFMFWAGPDFVDVHGGGHHKMVLLWGGNRARMTSREYYTDYRTFAPCISAGGGCTFYQDAAKNPDGSDTYRINDYAEEWIYIEFEVIASTHVRVYIYTQDGTFNGEYETTEGDDEIQNSSVSAPYAINLLFGYWEGLSGVTSDAYLKLDDLKISTSFIGPPDGFTDGGADPTPTSQGISGSFTIQ